MNISANKSKFHTNLLQFNPDVHLNERMLALFAAAVTFDESQITKSAILKAHDFKVSREEMYEIVIQSYLFLGFPRMLQAADVLQQVIPVNCRGNENSNFLSENSLSEWYKDGEEVCQKVYKKKYEPLKEKVLAFAPEIYHWMIAEGYGKVLSRKNLPLVTRELAIVSFLTMENRERQLRSHIIGAVNVGATKELVKLVIDDIGEAAGDGYGTALSLWKKLKE